ncbi:MerR family transcriptional regulator [Holdemanella porci]|uniref:MerR family transcriptional regulator n=1 Tax=Holdemanella porci TaxID=2652276 RepID=UPI002DDBAFD1|nr:MerR family transcriptional regulator [Holdemanella porci]
MSKYTTGEIAKLCGVSVRTVQYYDSRNILVPSELSEGGRRLYSEQDLKRMKIICFLRDAGISINNIGELLSEDDPGSVISVLLEQQEQALREEVSERQEKLAILDGIKKELRGIDNFSVESIGDIAYAMENKKNMQKLHAILLITGIPLGIIQWTSIVLWITMGIWWLFGSLVVALTVLFSTLSNSNTGVLAGTGCTVLVSYLIGLIPKAKEYLPTLLMDGNSLIYGTVEARSYVTAIYITVLLNVVYLAISFPVFNKKYL